MNILQLLLLLAALPFGGSTTQVGGPATRVTLHVEPEVGVSARVKFCQDEIGGLRRCGSQHFNYAGTTDVIPYGTPHNDEDVIFTEASLCHDTSYLDVYLPSATRWERAEIAWDRLKEMGCRFLSALQYNHEEKVSKALVECPDIPRPITFKGERLWRVLAGLDPELPIIKIKVKVKIPEGTDFGKAQGAEESKNGKLICPYGDRDSGYNFAILRIQVDGKLEDLELRLYRDEHGCFHLERMGPRRSHYHLRG